jgi:hypothetical protein
VILLFKKTRSVSLYVGLILSGVMAAHYGYMVYVLSQFQGGWPI